jgi:hypothetical protein
MKSLREWGSGVVRARRAWLATSLIVHSPHCAHMWERHGLCPPRMTHPHRADTVTRDAVPALFLLVR